MGKNTWEIRGQKHMGNTWAQTHGKYVGKTTWDIRGQKHMGYTWENTHIKTRGIYMEKKHI